MRRLLAATFAAVVAPARLASAQSITPELAAPVAPAQPDPWHHRGPVIAAGPGGAHLVVYRTGKAFPTNVTEMVHATRIDAAGNLLDPIALELGNTGYNYRQVVEPWRLRMAATSTGAGYLVVWAVGNLEARFIPYGGGSITSLTITSPVFQVRWPSVACSPTECLVAWWTFENGVGHRVWLARVASGVVLQAAFPVTTASGDQHEPAVAWNGTNYIVAWRDIRRPDGGDVYATRVTTAGVVLDPMGIAIAQGPATEENIALSAGAASVLAVWHDNRSGGSEIWGARIDSNGNLADAGGRLYATATGSEPAAAWDGTQHLVAWSASGAAMGLRIAGDGTPDSAGVTTLAASTVSRPELAATTDKHFVTWVEANRLPSESVFVRPLPRGGAPGPALAPAGVVSAESDPSVASDGSQFMLAWTDTRHAWKSIYASRFDTSGNFLDGTGVPLSPIKVPGLDRFGPTIAYGNGMYLAAWQARPTVGNMTIEAARFAPDGRVLDASPMVLASSVFHADFPRPQIAWNGTSWYVAWVGFSGIEGRRVMPDGTLPESAPTAISRSPSNITRDPSVAWSGAIHLVSWTDGRPGTNSTYGARLDAEGKHLSSQDIAIAGASTRGDIDHATAGNGGNGLLLVYIEPGVSVDDGRLRAKRLDTMGMPIDTTAIDISGAFDDTLRPRAVWDGNNWFVTWVSRGLTGGSEGLRAMRVSPWGTLINPPAEVTPRRSSFARPSLASTGNGITAMFWPRGVSSSTFNARANESHIFGAIANCPTGTCVGPPAPDAGVMPTVDGGITVDAATDAGRPPGSGGGGGCSTSRSRAPASWPGAVALALLALAIRASSCRRRGTGPR